ncbi:MAG: hypothetical protein M3407_04350 [Acidobacteriota bacterium]|nr:hypothetical protein [Acidobacteriota bacterium]
MSDDAGEPEASADNFSAAAKVVEAARQLEATSWKVKDFQEATMDAYLEERKAKEGRQHALDKLKQADTGRKAN